MAQGRILLEKKKGVGKERGSFSFCFSFFFDPHEFHSGEKGIKTK
jgi:hypothetical protein